MYSKALKACLLVALLMVVGCISEEKQAEPAPATTLPKFATTVPAKSAAIQTQKPVIKKEEKTSTKDIRDLETALKAGVPVVVKLGSDSCYPCRLMKPIMQELAVEQDGKAIFLDLDVYENRELARDAQVRVIPTILFYDKHGNPKAKSEGAMSKEDLLKAIEELDLPAGRQG